MLKEVAAAQLHQPKSFHGIDMERAIKLVGQAKTIPEAQLVLVRSIPTAFPPSEFMHIATMDDVRRAKSELGDAKTPVLMGILAATCTEYHRQQLLGDLRADPKIVRHAIRNLVNSRGRLVQGTKLSKLVKKTGRGTHLKLKRTKTAKAAQEVTPPVPELAEASA